MKRAAIWTFSFGVLVAAAGLIFALQGMGYVGPTGGLIYHDPGWGTTGSAVMVLGVLILLGTVLLSRRQAAQT